MALAGMTYVTISGTVRKGDDTPEVGEISFAREVAITSSSQDVVSPPWTYDAQLDPAGSFSISIPATDDPDWAPTYTYRVTEKYSSGTRSYVIAVPAATPGSALNIADVAPVAGDADQASYVLTTLLGQPNGVATLGPDGLLTTEQRPAGGGGGSVDPSNSVTSETTPGGAASAGVSVYYSRGDHTHGTPPLPNATDVGADPAGTASTAVTAHSSDADPHGDRAYSDAELAAGLATKSDVGHTHGTSSMIMEWYVDTASAGVGSLRRYNDTGSALTIVAIRVRANIAGPTGATGIQVDLNIDGTTVFTTQANRPTIPPGSVDSGKVTSMDVTSVPDGSYLTVDFDTVGSIVPGSGILIAVTLQ